MNECSAARLCIAKEFEECRKAIIAIGDETRQHIITALLQNENAGMRVGEITDKTHLSRPAVSHHLQMLKDAKIIAMRRVGTRNYYYMNANETEWGKLTKLVNHVNEVIQKASAADYPSSQLGLEG
ncbi:MAG: ArsR/SmtB family transcription factor [Oscillospiraceae bacterium]